MKITNKQPAIMFLAIATAVTHTFTACEKKGPVEEMGEKIDEAGESVKETFDKDGPAEKAGESIDKAIDGEK